MKNDCKLTLNWLCPFVIQSYLFNCVKRKVGSSLILTHVPLGISSSSSSSSSISTWIYTLWFSSVLIAFTFCLFASSHLRTFTFPLPHFLHAPITTLDTRLQDTPTPPLLTQLTGLDSVVVLRLLAAYTHPTMLFVTRPRCLCVLIPPLSRPENYMRRCSSLLYLLGCLENIWALPFFLGLNITVQGSLVGWAWKDEEFAPLYTTHIAQLWFCESRLGTCHTENSYRFAQSVCLFV